MVFVGNTSHTVPYMLKHSDLFDELPESYHDSAYLDRLHSYIPGWEIDTIRGEMFSNGYGFVVDYIAEVLKSMRNLDYSDRYQQYFTLGSDISTRDRDGIHKTFSGLMKLLYPHEQATAEEIEEILRFAIEGRKRVKDQILRMDGTMAAVKFGFQPIGGDWQAVTTLEEEEYPAHYHRGVAPEPSHDADIATHEAVAQPALSTQPEAKALFEGHRDYAENQRGVSFETILMPYLRNATEIELHDPYIRMNHQGRNLVELLAMIAAAKDPADVVKVRLYTVLDSDSAYQQRQLEMLQQIINSALQQGVAVKVEKDPGGHDRWIRTDTGWRINLGRGLDIFQKADGGWFEFGTSKQEFRQVRGFGVTYIRDPR